MQSGQDLFPSDDILSVTAWMFGVFGSQVTIGNTSFNKLLSVCRNPLNVLKASGQRIFLRTDRGDQLLGLPSAFEMGPNSARWIYHDDRFTLTIRVATSLDAPACRLTVDVERGGPVQLLVSHDVVLGENEYDAPGRMVADAARGRVELRPAPEALMSKRYPEATFFIVSPDAERIEAIGGDGLLREDGGGRGAAHVVVRTKPITRFSLVLTGNVLSARRAEELATVYGQAATPGRTDPDEDPQPETNVSSSRRGWQAILGGATGRTADDLARLNDVLRWYLHDALIHYTTPHGLEQYSGAAWGLRDVCQGPVELLVATGNLVPLRALLKIVYEHQYRQSGDWPQWFMFDRFREILAAESHADIIHWPIKALCDYIEASGDLSILDERVGYTDDRTMALTPDTETIFAHTERQIAKIERDCIADTALVVFGGGDWEDSLQPADPAMARRMVSAWTVELAYQTLGRYRTVCDRAGKSAMADRLADLCARMRSDFNRYLVPDGVVAGLAHFGSDGVEYFLHPRDRKTGIAYRLLPMTRGMISGLFSVEQAQRHAALIERHLSFPDGVRLMNRPMEYRGGTSRYFKRAESAANFGREIGLQYVHAHIRYVEAMARIGRPDEAFRGLLAVCPIRLDLDVPSAHPRQSNAYFSSSDAAFMDRRQASRQFGRIRSGRVGVKGGWRVYSSGPGIYINQLISNVLGLRTYFDDVVFDPVLPRGADGLTFDFTYEGRPVRYLYHVAGDGFSPREVTVNGRPLAAGRYADNPYRRGGMLISKRAFGEALDRAENLVEIST
jgi:cellobiose phosphorylase